MYNLEWTNSAIRKFKDLEKQAQKTFNNRSLKKKTKSSLQEGIFKQVLKTLKFLQENPRHPSLKTHPYNSLQPPWSKNEKIFEAYVQNKTPSAYRIFWCYGPNKNTITIIAITPHP